MNPLPSLPRWVMTSGALALTLGAGVLIGRATHSSSENSSAGASEHASRSSSRGQADAERSATSRSRSQDGERSASRNRGDRSLSDILSSTSRLDRTQRLLAFLDRLPSDQFASVYEEMRNSPLARLQGSERSLILQAWAERDPLSALSFLQENGADDWERETTVATWAASDPQGAFAWAMAAHDDGQINNWVLGSLRGMASTNPEMARDYLSQLEGPIRDRAIRDIEPYITQYGFDYARNWIAQISNSDLQGQASRTLARSLADLDPTQASAWNTAIADTNTRRDVSEIVSDRWARTDLESAKSWVSSLPEDTKSEAAEGVARHYARQDPAAAAQWLASLGSNPDLDGARRIYIEEAFRSSPENSLNFVSNLSDQRARDGYYWRYLSGWARNDAAAARAWINRNASSLPPQLVERFSRQQ